MVVQSRLELIAPGGEIGERTGEFGKRFFRGRERRVGVFDALVDADSRIAFGLRFGFQRRFLDIQLLECRRALVAFEIGGELFEPAIEFADAFLGARLFTFKRFAGR